MALPPRLQQELDEFLPLQKVTVIEDASFINLLFSDFPVGDGFNMPACDLLGTDSSLLS